MTERQGPPHDPLDPHEEALVRAFVAPDRRARVLSTLGRPKGRKTFIRSLAHTPPLDWTFVHRLPPQDQTVDTIYALLKGRGAPDICHVIGESSLDGQDVDLHKALESLVETPFANLISCIPGRLGYYRGERYNERYILER